MLALTTHVGIESSPDESVDACVELTDELDMRHELVSYGEEFGIRMDDVVKHDPGPCGYCGVFRHDLLAGTPMSTARTSC